MNRNKNGIMTVVWGAGRLYHTYKKFIEAKYGIDYICDRKFTTSDTEYEGYRIIAPNELNDIEKCIIILCIVDEDEMNKIKASMHSGYHEILRLIDLIPIDRKLTEKEIIPHIMQGGYSDYYGNEIKSDSLECLNKISFRFDGKNGSIIIGKNVWIAKHLEIECGTNGSVIIGDNATFDNVVIYSAYADVNIGKDCMLSYDVFIRNHDSHFIFDKETGKRINYSRNIIIGNHVWIGQRSLLLSGFNIEDGSIVGAGSVSSSSFGANQVIAGNPAKVIRNDVYWDRSMTWDNNYNSVDEIQSYS